MQNSFQLMKLLTLADFLHVKTNSTHYAAPMWCTYQINSSCGEFYIGHTHRNLIYRHNDHNAAVKSCTPLL